MGFARSAQGIDRPHGSFHHVLHASLVSTDAEIIQARSSPIGSAVVRSFGCRPRDTVGRYAISPKRSEECRDCKTMSDTAKTDIDVHDVGSFRRPLRLADRDDLTDRVPYGARAAGIELVIVRFGPGHSVFSGRCQHRGALLVDGRVVGDDLVCGLHGWDYRLDTGVSDPELV